MINRTTGQIELAVDGISVGPSVTLEQVLASPTARAVKVLDLGGGTVCLSMRKVRCVGHDIDCTLIFEDLVLRRVAIECADPMFDELVWLIWNASEKHDLERKRLLLMERKRVHDSMSVTGLGSDWREQHFVWGSVDSHFTEKRGGSSLILVTYGGQPGRREDRPPGHATCRAGLRPALPDAPA